MSESKQPKTIVKHGKTVYIYPCDECGKDVEFDQPITTAVLCRECTAPDYESKCEVCGATPVLPQSGMCGPCTFGEADTADGNW